MRSAETSPALAVAVGDRELVRSGAELVELSERFYRGLFVGALSFVGISAVAALAFLPLRESVHTGTPITVVLTGVVALLAPLAVSRAPAVYRLLRRGVGVELAIVVLAAALVSYPLRSELWWPSCALLMLVAILAPWPRVLAYCVLVLLVNLAAHAIAGDLTETPVVTIVGLWVGLPFWSMTFSVISDRFAAYVLRLQSTLARSAQFADQPVRVTAWTDDDDRSDDAADDGAPTAADPPVDDGEGVLRRLTPRQLQVTALLIDGLRYADVAACLLISERQVTRHVSNAIVRAGVRTANELVAVAVAEGLAPGGTFGRSGGSAEA